MANYPKANLMTKQEVVTPYKQAYRYAFTERFDHVNEPNPPEYSLGDGIEAVGSKKRGANVSASKCGYEKNSAVIVIVLVLSLLAVAFAALSYFELTFLESLPVLGGTIATVVDGAIELDYASIALLASIVVAVTLVITAIIGLAVNGRILYWLAALVAVVLAAVAGVLVLVDAGFDDILGTLGYGFIAIIGLELLALICACFANSKVCE